MSVNITKLAKACVATAALIAGVGATAQSANAQMTDCDYRGKLAERYCDMNRDMVADLPLDESEWTDPDTLIFSYVPVEDPAIYKETFQPLMEHLEEVTGKDIRFFSAQSYAAQIEALRSGRLHVAGLSTGSTPFGVNIAGFNPFAIMGTDEGEYGYKMQVITPADSDIESIQDLNGKTVAHTEQASNSGNQAPRALLESQFGIVPGEDYEVTYSGGHDRSILGVANGDYAAAPIASSVLDRMAERGAVDLDDIRIIHESQSFPTTSFGHAHNLHPRLALLIQKAFYTFEFEGTSLGKEFSDVDGFLPITYKNNWQVIRTIQEQNEVEYTTDNISG
ncbi:phosphate/phosphite/phosphonate ABC transporter substrate-binding protein [Rhodovibrio salinarum]|uniref:Phosphate/phosphite/phosphonate ABC transporter substrate-binding protein n=1 Tax=Rhodovibrio salinarum TaxID=1087 RepID=A0A934QKG5_9PROT|nr:phosphate/phosphite/phosphonate ABC transporter substrate-binding protein [Rhodovibrio salinarum]MBK1698506.1 phosphate/phosphite/phosphonate ABC transporter substrate-binding protein [Rhodovibrio salinarum]